MGNKLGAWLTAKGDYKVLPSIDRFKQGGYHDDILQ
jgi:hypothetical protein